MCFHVFPHTLGEHKAQVPAEIPFSAQVELISLFGCSPPMSPHISPLQGVHGEVDRLGAGTVQGAISLFSHAQ